MTRRKIRSRRDKKINRRAISTTSYRQSAPTSRDIVGARRIPNTESLRSRLHGLYSAVPELLTRLRHGFQPAAWLRPDRAGSAGHELAQGLGTIFYWNVSPYCNYSCRHCCGPGCKPQRDAMNSHGQRGEDAHCFAVAEPSAWINRLTALAPGNARKSFWLTGGEPFLDFWRFMDLLRGLAALPGLDHIRIDTNGFWDADRCHDLDTSRIYLNVSYHESQTDLSSFLRRVLRMRERGFKIAMVNYVLSPEQRNGYETLRRHLATYGLFVNPGVFFPPGHYQPYEQDETELALYRRHLPLLDLGFKLGERSPRGLPCHHPTCTYMVRGSRIGVNCLADTWVDLFDDEVPALPTRPVPCPNERCGCIGMYSMLDAIPVQRRRSPNILVHYASDLKQHQRLAAAG